MNAESELLDLIRELRDTQRAHYEAYLRFTNTIEAQTEEVRAGDAERLRVAHESIAMQQREAYSRQRSDRSIRFVLLCFFLLSLGILIGYLYKLGSGS